MEKLVLQRVNRFYKGILSARIWKRIWTKNWVLKFISLVLAAVLWYFVGGEDTVDKNVMVPIEIINLPRDLVISNQFKKEIEVTVSGPRSLIQDMTTRMVTRQINLSKATPGTNVVENDNDSIEVSRGITVLRIQPSSIILSLDKLIQKQFEVKPVRIGTVAAGYILEELRMDPNVITITGPATILSQIDELPTETININGLTEPKQLQIPLNLETNIVDLIGETSVTADIIIRPKMIQKKLSGVPVDTADNGISRQISPDQVDIIANIPVLLTGKPDELKKLFDVTAVDENESGILKVKVIPRENVELPVEIISIIPSAVELVPEPSADGGRQIQTLDFKKQVQEIKADIADDRTTEDNSTTENNTDTASPASPSTLEETGDTKVRVLTTTKKKIIIQQQ